MSNFGGGNSMSKRQGGGRAERAQKTELSGLVGIYKMGQLKEVMSRELLIFIYF